ncbi:MAG: NAD-dependent epimerase/dehydratase family protein [Saprospiraceae bacterium]
MKKVFVTGGSGFVGKHIIPILIANQYKVYAIARSNPSAQFVEQLGATAVLDDLTILSSTTKNALQQCDYVLHAAAHMDFTYDPKPYLELNVNATHNLLRLAKAAGIQKFIYISAAPVVPDAPVINLTEAKAGNELPSALYPKTKAIAERAVLAANAKNFLTISLRPPAIWGPNNHHYNDLLKNVKTGNWRWIGGGEQILSTIHVKNLGNAILCAFESNLGGAAYFVTDGERRSMKSFFKGVLEAQGLNPGDKVLPLWIAKFAAQSIEIIWKLFRIKSRPPVAPLMIRLMGHEFSVSDEKARQELGYKNAISIEEGIAELKSSMLK